MENQLQTPLDRLKQVFTNFLLLPEYERTQLLAVETARVIKENAHERICSIMWMPFELLYVEMVKRGEITRIEDIGRDKALGFWTQACMTNPGADKNKRIMIMRALYVFNLITENINL